MAKWKLPEGRKPLTDADMVALTHRLADTAIERSELYQAAKRDAEEAEAYAAELEAKLATAVEALQKIANRPAEMIWGEDEEVRDAMRFMEKEAEAALAAIQKAKQ